MIYPSTIVAGPPGTGKSTLLGTAAALGPTVLLVTKPREANSWKYREAGLTEKAELFHDPKWLPALGLYQAGGFERLMRRIIDLQDDKEARVVLLDPLTDVVTLAAHSIMGPQKAETPRETADARQYYGELKYKLKNFVQALTALQFAEVPKHVLATVHTQPAKEDDAPGRPSAEKRGRTVQYEGNVLPMIEGGYRREIMADFDLVLFTSLKRTPPKGPGKPPGIEFRVQVAPTPDRHAKNALSGLSAVRDLPNSYPEVLKSFGVE